MPTSWIRGRAVETQLDDVKAGLAAEAARIGADSHACRAFLERPGKCLRATLALMSARFGPTDSHQVVRLAVGIEMLHTATLYHDDVIDAAPLRRGLPTASRHWGNAVAVYAGGYLMSRAIQLFAAAGDDVTRVASRFIDRLWKGEMEEVEHAGDVSVSVRRYLRIVTNKTGSLFELSCRLGALAGGVPRRETAALARFARKFGVAFQLADDVEDLLGSAAKLGKEPGTDLREGVFSLPVLYCVALGTADARRLAVRERRAASAGRERFDRERRLIGRAPVKQSSAEYRRLQTPGRPAWYPEGP